MEGLALTASLDTLAAYLSVLLRSRSPHELHNAIPALLSGGSSSADTANRLSEVLEQHCSGMHAVTILRVLPDLSRRLGARVSVEALHRLISGATECWRLSPPRGALIARVVVYRPRPQLHV